MSGEPDPVPLISFERVAVPQSDKGRRIKQRDYLPEGRIPVIDQGRSELGGYTDDEALAFDGALPVILFGDHTRAVKLVERRFAVGADGIKIFRPAEGVQPRYLYYWMRSARIPDRGYGRHYQYLRQMTVPVPSLAKQDEIVAELEKQFSRLDEAVANLQRVKANLKRYRNAVLTSALRGDLCNSPSEVVDAEGKDIGQDSETPEMAPDVSLPPTWSWVRADEICTVVASGSTPKPDDMNAGSGEVPFVKVYNLMFDGALDFTIKPTFIAAATHNGLLARSRCKPGDVLMNIVGPPLGKISIVPNEFSEWNINQAVVTFRANERVLNRLLAYWLMSPPVRKRIERTSKATAGQFNVQVSTCRRLVLPLPPLADQHRIVAETDRRLSIVREVEAEIDANLIRAQALRLAVLHRAFHG